MALRNFIASSLGLFILTQSYSSQNHTSRVHLYSQVSKTKTVENLTGEWKYNNTIWYSSEMTFWDNGTFKFHNQSCYGQSFTQGHWIIDSGIIYLSSYDTFKLTDGAKTIEKSSIQKTRTIKRKNKKGQTEYIYMGFDKTERPLLPGPNDTLRVYFDKVQLSLRNDTLYCIDQNKLLEGHKFTRSKNNR